MISNEFKENVNSGNVVTVRSALLDYLTIDLTFKKFDESLEYAKSKMDIMQEFDKQPLENNPEKWDDEYLSKQRILLLVNFSNERIKHVKNVTSKVMPQTEPQVKSGATLEKNVLREKKIKPNSVEQTKNESVTGKRIINEKEIKSDYPKQKGNTDEKLSNALIVGGTAVAVVGVAVSEPIIVSAGVVVAGAGVYLKIKK